MYKRAQEMSNQKPIVELLKGNKTNVMGPYPTLEIIFVLYGVETDMGPAYLENREREKLKKKGRGSRKTQRT